MSVKMPRSKRKLDTDSSSDEDNEIVAKKVRKTRAGTEAKKPKKSIETGRYNYTQPLWNLIKFCSKILQKYPQRNVSLRQEILQLNNLRNRLLGMKPNCYRERTTHP